MKTGILIIHGFAGKVSQVEPIKEYLSKKGYIVITPILRGHTGKVSDLWHVTYKDWIESAEEDLTKLLESVDKVIIIGFSMGGLIATHLAIKYKPVALITLSTPIYHWDLKRVAINLFFDLQKGRLKYIKKYIRSCCIPLRALLNFKCLLVKTKRLLKEVSCPVFVAQGMLDDTVQYRSAEYIYSNVNTAMKLKKYYPKSRHHICLGEDKHELFKDVEDFIVKELERNSNT